MNRKTTTDVCRIMLIAEHLYLDTNQYNPVTVAGLQEMLRGHGFEVSVDTVRKYVKVLAEEMEYPVKQVRMKKIGAPLGIYWEV